MFSAEFLGVAPWAILSAAVTWGTAAWTYRDKVKKEKVEQGDRLEVHRDGLTFELLQNARQEMANARVEVEDLRDEVRKLRAMEQHFYHFQQSLDHLEALLFAETTEAQAAAERNARAFLARMRRFNEAKSNAAARMEFAEKEIHAAEKGREGSDAQPAVFSKPA